jgi:hypothetical protein
MVTDGSKKTPGSLNKANAWSTPQTGNDILLYSTEQFINFLNKRKAEMKKTIIITIGLIMLMVVPLSARDAAREDRIVFTRGPLKIIIK